MYELLGDIPGIYVRLISVSIATHFTIPVILVCIRFKPASSEQLTLPVLKNDCMERSRIAIEEFQ
jgi:hypothetical protein